MPGTGKLVASTDGGIEEILIISACRQHGLWTRWRSLSVELQRLSRHRGLDRSCVSRSDRRSTPDANTD
jgi:hypothetical protein